jgi:regulator of protease activity HflC (stomatin/prohibitin superfamily)
MRTIYGPIYTLRPYERGIQEMVGKYDRFVMPGLGFQIPFIHIIRIRDIREHTMDIHPQPVITKDNVEIQVDGIVWVRPANDEDSIKRTFYNIDDWKRAIIQLAMANLCQEFGDLTLDESLVAREMIATNLQRILNTSAVEWGLTVSKVEIRLIDPPEDIKKAMHQRKTAEQQKLASIQRAEGERDAVIQVARGKAEAIRLVNQAAQQYSVGDAQALKLMEMTGTALSENGKILWTWPHDRLHTWEGISPRLFSKELESGEKPLFYSPAGPMSLERSRLGELLPSRDPEAAFSGLAVPQDPNFPDSGKEIG